jgi:transposase InsO family protein
VVKRRRPVRVLQRDEQLLPRVQQLKADHLAWGYRRVWAYLKYREGLLVNKKRIYRLLQEHRLLAHQTRRLRANRTPTRSKPRTQRPNELWGIDMTKILVNSWGWVYLHVVLDWGSKKIIGSELSLQSKTADWLRPLQREVNRQFPHGLRESDGLQLVSDNGCQPTSVRFLRECRLLGIQQIFTSYDNPKGNADTERVIRTLKEDLLWPREWLTVEQLEQALAGWVRDYNEDYPHSALGYQTPQQFETSFNPPPSTPKTLQIAACFTGSTTARLSLTGPASLDFATRSTTRARVAGCRPR